MVNGMDLLEEAARFGIDPTFTDGKGERREAGPQVLQNVIDALGAPREGAGPLVARRRGGEGRVSLDIEQFVAPLQGWRLRDEQGDVVAQGDTEEVRAWLPALADGVYRLCDDEGAQETTLVLAPEAAFRGAFDRHWILAVQLYGVKSARNWGVGDFTDLERLLGWAASVGAAGIGLNPLHALFDDHAADCSPYSPSSRLFLNSIYIDVAKLPELPPDFVTRHADEIAQLQRSELVDYVGVAALKAQALHLAFQNFKTRTTLQRKTSFDAFRRAGGAVLSRYACFEVLRRKFAGPWWDWPQPWRQPDDGALASLRQGVDAREIEFAEFVQWCAEQQLAACANLAERLKLPIGLYLDVAVGVKADGFDAWNEQSAISRRLSVGAPPDQVNTAGQDWGLAGYNAAGLERCAFAPFRQMLRAAMRHAGAIRLDHVLGLNRLYVVPHGYAPDQGVYIQMPFEAMLALVALESAAQHCIVIGEDLGTVPEGFREQLADWAIWSYRVMMFEREEAGSFHAPEHYPENALVTFSTHDLATFAGWRAAHDLALKQALGIDPGETREARDAALAWLSEALGAPYGAGAEFMAALRHMSRSRARLLAVEIEDLLGVIDQANVPGTVDEHPNWRRRLPYPIEAWGERIDLDGLRASLSGREI